MFGRTFPVIALAVVGFVSAVREQPPWLGTWEQDLVRSTNESTVERYKRVTTRIEPWKDGIRVTYDRVGVRGGVTHQEWLGKFDGMDYPVHGVDTVLTNAYRTIDERSYEIVVKADGELAATATVVVSPDSRTMTVVTKETHSGQETTAVYQRR